MTKKKIIIIGAGPAGLGCGYELLEKNKNLKVKIFDKNNTPGGLARTHQFKNHYFDVGPHRFYTKNQEVLNLWKKTLGKEFVEVPRLTRIIYNNKFFYYPIKLKDILINLGFIESFKSGISFVYAKVFLRNKEAKTFEDWIVKNFGKKLFTIFFKTYTEKVWGIKCNEIGAEWAAQRIKNLNFLTVLKNALFGGKGNNAKSLIDKFYYPKKGAGEMYQVMSSNIKKLGGKVNLKSKITSISHKKDRINAISYLNNGKKETETADYFFSSMPLTDFVLNMTPKPAANIINAAKKLYYRDHITVNLLIKKTDIFPDNWIYVHSPEVKMARIANYNNFSHDKKQVTTALGVEYFVFQNDEIWKQTDKELIELAKDELEKLNLVDSKLVSHGFVMRETESYPTYYMGHKKYFDLLKDYVKSFGNLQLIGRGGMYKYNNMDHSIYSGILAARNFNSGQQKYDVWEINEDAEYLEESRK